MRKLNLLLIIFIALLPQQSWAQECVQFRKKLDQYSQEGWEIAREKKVKLNIYGENANLFNTQDSANVLLLRKKKPSYYYDYDLFEHKKKKKKNEAEQLRVRYEYQMISFFPYTVNVQWDDELQKKYERILRMKDCKESRPWSAYANSNNVHYGYLGYTNDGWPYYEENIGLIDIVEYDLYDDKMFHLRFYNDNQTAADPFFILTKNESYPPYVKHPISYATIFDFRGRGSCSLQDTGLFVQYTDYADSTTYFNINEIGIEVSLEPTELTAELFEQGMKIREYCSVLEKCDTNTCSQKFFNVLDSLSHIYYDSKLDYFCTLTTKQIESLENMIKRCAEKENPEAMLWAARILSKEDYGSYTFDITRYNGIRYYLTLALQGDKRAIYELKNTIKHWGYERLEECIRFMKIDKEAGLISDEEYQKRILYLINTLF